MTTVAAPSAVATFEAAWLISRAALHAAGLASAAGPDGTLRWRILDGEAVAELMVDQRTRELARALVIREADGDFTHVASPGQIFDATFGSEGRCLYVRTSLLQTVGLSGGRYEAKSQL